MGSYQGLEGPQDHDAAADLAANWDHDLEGAFVHFRKEFPLDWVQNEANQILKRRYPTYRQMWEDAWNAIVEEEQRKSREYEKWFHRNDKW